MRAGRWQLTSSRLGRIAPDGQAALERYAAATIPLIRAAGGEVVCRLQPTETMVGGDEDRPHLVAVMRFDTADAIRAFLGSESYRRQLPHRDEAFSEIHSYVAVEM